MNKAENTKIPEPGACQFLLRQASRQPMRQAHLCFLASCLSLASCGGGSGQGGAQTYEGRWVSHVASTDHQACAYTLQLKHDLTWEDTSNQKVRTGSYTLEPTSDKGTLPALIQLTTLTDNGLADCSGNDYTSTSTKQTILLNNGGAEMIAPQQQITSSSGPGSPIPADTPLNYVGKPADLPPIAYQVPVRSTDANPAANVLMPAPETVVANATAPIITSAAQPTETTTVTAAHAAMQAQSPDSDTVTSTDQQSAEVATNSTDSEQNPTPTPTAVSATTVTTAHEAIQTQSPDSDTVTSTDQQSAEVATNSTDSEQNPTPTPAAVSESSPGGTLIRDSDWVVNRSENVSFGDHSGDAGYLPSHSSDRNAIRVRLKEGSNYGTGSYFLMPQDTQEAWVSFCIRFSNSWDTSVAGKLPGFAGNPSPVNGGQGGLPSDGTNAWSARMLYGPYDAANDAIPLGQYIYHTAQSEVSQYGDPDWWSPLPHRLVAESARAQRQQWHAITQRIRMNTRNESNGLIEAWVDGNKVYSRSDLNFTNNPEYLKVERFWLDTYHGGGATSPKDQLVYYDQVNYSVGANQTSTDCEN